jgi:adenosylhomocysteine nucleosidase
MPRIAIVSALEREVGGLVGNWKRIQRNHDDRAFTFFEHDDVVCVCGGIGVQAARRATEAVIALYHPTLAQSVGFTGALDAQLNVGDIFTPGIVIDARVGSRFSVPGGKGTLVTFMEVAGTAQKAKLAKAYAAEAVDMEAAAVAAAAASHGIDFRAVKVISDDANFEIPGMARFIDSNGQFRTVNFALHAVVRPWLWWRTAVLAANSNKAAKVLSEYLRHSFVQPEEKTSAAPARSAGGRN